MSWSHLHSSSAKGEIYSLVCNNWYFAANNRYDGHSANQVFVTRVFGIDGHSSITKDCLWTCSCNANIFSGLISGSNKLGPYRLQRITHIRQGTRCLDMIDFQVRKCAHTPWAPVDDTFSTINEPLFIKAYEDFTHCFR